jgi:hypothetical protein
MSAPPRRAMARRGAAGTRHRGAARGLLGALALLLLLGACGKVGPVRPPGPAEQVTYPRLYPNR